MTRLEIIQAAMAAAGASQLTPVQIQKMLFLVDENLFAPLQQRKFDFVPYDYGPFDSGIYRDLEFLASAGKVSINTPANSRLRTYSLTEYGLRCGQEKLNSLSPDAVEYIQKLVAWVKKLSFAQLVTAIYDQFPDMKVNSVFQH